MATRKALLERENQIEKAQQGRDLLEEKQTALIRELQQVAEKAQQLSDQIDQSAQRARLALARANAFDGDYAVRSAGLNVAPERHISIDTQTTMGVLLPTFSLHPEEIEPNLPTATLDEAALAFHEWVRMIVRLADMQLRVKRLIDELDTTSRRLNALDHKTIPRLEQERDAIELSLAERERASQTRLKLAKKLLSS